ncbi:MAG: hypothetical protein ACI915_002348 [Gammaproteobacteria bacterium]|jgi:hypothetical protein
MSPTVLLSEESLFVFHYGLHIKQRAFLRASTAILGLCALRAITEKQALRYLLKIKYDNLLTACPNWL